MAIFAKILKSDLIYRQCTALIILAAFLAQTFSRTFVVADYYANTGKYETYCENKARPEIHCHGKCQMIKQLQQAEKKDQENPGRKSANNSDIVFTTKSFFVLESTPYSIIRTSKKGSAASCSKSVDRSFDIFRPPQV